MNPSSVAWWEIPRIPSNLSFEKGLKALRMGLTCASHQYSAEKDNVDRLARELHPRPNTNQRSPEPTVQQIEQKEDSGQ